MINENDNPWTDASEQNQAAPGEAGAADIESQPSEAQPTSMAALQAELEKVQTQSVEYLDGWQRARAEFANFKRRVEAEREEIRCRSNETLLLKLLPVVDDFERAMQVVPVEVADTPWVNGVAMILNKLQTLLESENVATVQTVGQPFDPQWHEAMMQEETDEYPDGTVVQELRKGYRLGDRTLRPALVKVASNSKKEPTTAAGV